MDLKSRVLMAVATVYGSIPIMAADKFTEIEVTALPPSIEKTADSYGVISLSQTDLSERPELRLDERLASIPSFGLFRRSGSQVAHPTAQGVTLRSIAPNGAGRTLVLLDGVPQGDPFGGWINWARLPLLDIETIHILRGAGNGAWGSGALAGTINIISNSPVAPETKVSASYGSSDTFDVSVSTYVGDENDGVSLSGNYYNTDGFYIIDADQRGAIDTRASGEGGWFRLRGTLLVADDYRLRFTAGYSEESRLNGTSYTANGLRVWETAMQLFRDGQDEGDWSVEIGGYLRDQSFYSRFSAVADDRNSETPALDQYRVPSTAFGFNAKAAKNVGHGLHLSIGADYRHTSGSTHEQFFYTGGSFVRDRTAGGEQTLAGSFIDLVKDLSATVSVSLGGRVDHFKNTGGYRREINLVEQSVTRTDQYASSSEWLYGGRVGLAWHLDTAWKLFGSIYTGSRAPSLNELYRPFRVGSDITEANPALTVETSYGGELGFLYDQKDLGSLRLTYFKNWLNDGVGNVTLSGGGFYAPLGVFVPLNGTISQRLNVDEITVDGLEADIHVGLTKGMDVHVSYFWSNARISSATVRPALVGNRLAQTPRHKAYAALTLQPDEKWLVRLSVKATSKQYDDDANSRLLAGFAVVDLYASYEVREGLKLFVAGLNLFDERVITGLRSNGLISVAEPASVRVGIQAAF